MRIVQVIASLLKQDQGQDLVEYALLMAFFVLVAVALYTGITNNINAIWTGITNRLANTD